MFRCLKPGCPVGCGTRRIPSCTDRMLGRAFSLILAAVLLVSLGIGFRNLHEAVRLTAISESSPLASPEMIELMSEA